MRTIRVSAVALCVIGCAAPAKLPVESGTGPKPDLPAPQTALIPIIHVARATGSQPRPIGTSADGLCVSRLAAPLDPSRWVCVLDNGDGLVEGPDAFSWAQ